MRGGVVAHVAHAAFGIGDGGDAIADMEILFRDDAMGDQASNRIIRTANLGELERFGIVVERAGVGDLAAGFGVDRGAVQDDFGLGSGLDFVYGAFFGDDGLDARVARLGAKVEILFGLVRLREFRVDGIGGILLRTFPGGLGARTLFLHRALETIQIQTEALVA